MQRKIPQQGRIQESPYKGSQPSRGCQHTILPSFPEKLHESYKILGHRGRRALGGGHSLGSATAQLAPFPQLFTTRCFTHGNTLPSCGISSTQPLLRHLMEHVTMHSSSSEQNHLILFSRSCLLDNCTMSESLIVLGEPLNLKELCETV